MYNMMHIFQENVVIQKDVIIEHVFKSLIYFIIW